MFPIYLFPAPPFRRRNAQALTAHAPPMPNGLCAEISDKKTESPASEYLRGHGSFLRCGRCAADLCPTSAIVSRGFTGRWGRAYLVSASTSLPIPSPTHSIVSLPNTHLHKPVSRQLVTGAHTVSDVSCAFCSNVLGWKYVDAEEELQKYKVGKFILETKRVSVATCWEHESLDFSEHASRAARGASTDSETLEFDSQDEDECEDLFAGMWTPSLALKRRRAKIFGRHSQR